MLLGRVLIKGYFARIVFLLSPFCLGTVKKGMKFKNKLKNKARKTEMEVLGIEILDSKGEPREQAMKAYRKLLFASVDELTYLARV
jgi:uncharacterized protein (DUF488 family)